MFSTRSTSDSTQVSSRTRQSNCSRFRRNQSKGVKKAFNRSLVEILMFSPESDLDNLSWGDSSFESHQPKISVKPRRRKSKSMVTDSASIQGCRNHQEDTHCSFTEELSNLGKVFVNMVADGHDGNQVSQFLASEQGAWSILKRHILSLVNDSDDDHGMINAFDKAIEEIVETAPKESGSTMVLSVLIESTRTSYNYSIGDSRFVHSDSEGNILRGPMRIIDYALETDVSKVGQFVNDLHQISCQVRPDPPSAFYKAGTPLSKVDLSNWWFPGDGNYSASSWKNPRDPSENNHKEWTAWNTSLHANPEQVLTYPVHCHNAYRMGSIQPTRTIGPGERTCQKGELYICKLPNLNGRSFFFCDGVEDNGAMSVETLCKASFNLSDFSDKFLSQGLHIGIFNSQNLESQGFEKCDPNATLADKVTWVYNMIMGPIRNQTDFAWRRGLQEAHDHCNKIDIQNPTADDLAYLCSAKLSADNVTLIINSYN